MSDLGAAIQAWLSADSQIADFVSGNIFSDYLPQSVKSPAIVYWIVSSEPENLIDGDFYMEPADVQFDCHGRSRSQATALWRLVRVRLLAAAYQTIAETEIKEVSQARGMLWAFDRPEEATDTRRFICSQDFSFWYCSN